MPFLRFSLSGTAIGLSLSLSTHAPLGDRTAMNLKLPLSLFTAAALLPHLCAQTTGTSHPEALGDPIASTDTAPQNSQHYVKPSPAVQMGTDPAAATAPQLNTRSADIYGPYVPYNGGKPSPSSIPSDSTDAPASNFVSGSTVTVTDDPTSGVVMSVHTGPNDLPIGTRLTAQLQTPISTKVTLAGTPFTAALITDVLHQGRVLLPTGSIIHGRITQIHGGHRISGTSAIRLQPDSVSLPDGTTYRVDAEVSDLDHYQDSHVNHEGTIVANGHGKTTGIIIGATTGTAVVAGAMLGGGVGAVAGLAVGAGIGTVIWLKQDHQQTLDPGTEIVFALNGPLHVSPVAR
jgi:hypothetical protein